MYATVNGVRLYFDVEGAGLVADGPTMRQKPTLVLVHGGPGADHSGYKPFFSALADLAQIVFFDNRGDGRSDRGPRDAWTLDQWADDLHGLCNFLGVERPIVYGASFGGIVAMHCAIRYPALMGRLVLVSTLARAAGYADARIAMFERLGGVQAGALARRRFRDGDASPAVLREWLRVALPLYGRSAPNPFAREREIHNPDTTAWFNRPGGEAGRFDCLAALHEIRCPVLVLGGELDPMTPIGCQRDIAAALPPDRTTFHAFAECGHGVVADQPEAALAVLRGFIGAPVSPC